MYIYIYICIYICIYDMSMYIYIGRYLVCYVVKKEKGPPSLNLHTNFGASLYIYIYIYKHAAWIGP